METLIARHRGIARDDGIVGWRPQVEKANIYLHADKLIFLHQEMRSWEIQQSKLLWVFFSPWPDLQQCSGRIVLKTQLTAFTHSYISSDVAFQRRGTPGIQRNIKGEGIINVFLVSHLGKKKNQTGCNFLCLDLVVPWGVWLRGSCLLSSCPATLCSFLRKKKVRQKTKIFHVCNKTSCYVIQEKHYAIIQGLEGIHLPDWRRKAKYRQVLVSRKMAWRRICVQDQIHFRKRRKWDTTIDVESSPVGSNLRVCLPSALPSSLPHLKTAQTPLDPHSPLCLSNSAKASS